MLKSSHGEARQPVHGVEVSNHSKDRRLLLEALQESTALRRSRGGQELSGRREMPTLFRTPMRPTVPRVGPLRAALRARAAIREGRQREGAASAADMGLLGRWLRSNSSSKGPMPEALQKAVRQSSRLLGRWLRAASRCEGLLRHALQPNEIMGQRDGGAACAFAPTSSQRIHGHRPGRVRHGARREGSPRRESPRLHPAAPSCNGRGARSTASSVGAGPSPQRQPSRQRACQSRALGHDSSLRPARAGSPRLRPQDHRSLRLADCTAGVSP